jgi:hypothetical protein
MAFFTPKSETQKPQFPQKPHALVIPSAARDLLVLFTPFTLNESEGSEAEGSAACLPSVAFGVGGPAACPLLFVIPSAARNLIPGGFLLALRMGCFTPAQHDSRCLSTTSQLGRGACLPQAGSAPALPARVGQGLACPEWSRRVPCRLVILSGAKDLLVLFTLNESEGSEAEGPLPRGRPGCSWLSLPVGQTFLSAAFDLSAIAPSLHRAPWPVPRFSAGPLPRERLYFRVGLGFAPAAPCTLRQFGRGARHPPCPLLFVIPSAARNLIPGGFLLALRMGCFTPAQHDKRCVRTTSQFGRGAPHPLFARL